MKTQFTQVLVNVVKIKRQHLQFILTLLALILLVLGAGAPDNGGLVGH
jgi:hypothetical protein